MKIYIMILEDIEIEICSYVKNNGFIKLFRFYISKLTLMTTNNI